MSESKFVIKCSTHGDDLLEGLKDQFEKKHNFDVTLECQGKLLKAHRVVLAASSPYFQDLLNNPDFATGSHRTVAMFGFEYEILQAIIEYMYRGEVVVPATGIVSLFEAAKTLQVKGMQTALSSWNEFAQQQLQQAQSRGEGTAGAGFPNNAFKIPPVPKTPAAQTRFKTTGMGKKAPGKVQPKDIQNQQPQQKVPITHPLPGQAPTQKRKACSNGLGKEAQGKVGQKDIQVQQQQPKIAKTRPVKGPVATTKREGFSGPPSALKIFKTAWREQLTTAYPTESFEDINERMDLLWSSMSSEIRKIYDDAASKAKIAYQKAYPFYKFDKTKFTLTKILASVREQKLDDLAENVYNLTA